ncbi:hypothetical protein CFP56_032632 [Quercus suber]|uniref:Uncharacterized protein n=1 Tax=Quercus suber TaxID=58331 RepID=A0AAW0JGG5_QUESU|nr:hypothetical protein CFP56_65589 [Quercus suber]
MWAIAAAMADLSLDTNPNPHKIQSFQIREFLKPVQLRMTPLLRKKLYPNQNYSHHSPLLHQFQLKCICELSDQIESFDFESCLRPFEQGLLMWPGNLAFMEQYS